MGFLDSVRRLSRELAEHKDEHVSERGTINAFVNPFLSLLGHAPSKLSQVVHEYTADIGTKRGEKVDIAVLRDGKPIMLIECKKLNTRLGPDEISQLYRYFGTTDARLGVLTNGLAYMFFSDTEKQNVMDRRPFFTLDILDFTDTQARTLERFTRARFNESGMLDTARFLKHAASVESRIAEELAGPSDAFVDFFARPVHQGRMTAEVRERFRDVLAAGIRQFVESNAGNMPQLGRDASGTASTRGTSRARDHARMTPPTSRAPGDRVSAREPVRPSRYSGKTIRAKVGSNPRRVGGHGFRSMEIVLGAMPQGIMYEEYKARGGRTKDLAWDIARGWTEVVDLSQDQFPPRPTAGSGGRVTVKDAMYFTLMRLGRDGGVTAKVLRETAEKTFDREITSKTAGNALWFLKQEGKIRREGRLWFLSDAPSAEDA